MYGEARLGNARLPGEEASFFFLPRILEAEVCLQVTSQIRTALEQFEGLQRVEHGVKEVKGSVENIGGAVGRVEGAVEEVKEGRQCSEGTKN